MFEVDQVEKVDFIESIIQEHVDREFMEDPIERALVWSESNDQLKSERVGPTESSIERVRSKSIMHVGHWSPTFEPIATSVIKLVPSHLKSNEITLPRTSEC